MANPAVRSASSNVTDIDASSIVCTHPSGLTAGDLMVLFVGIFSPSNARTITTPTDWTIVESTVESGGDYRFICYKKVADSGDVSAGSTTVSFSGTVDKSGFGMLAITGAADGQEITISDSTELASSTVSTVTISTSLTPFTNESMVISAFYLTDFNLAATLTSSNYTLTPTTTLTEQVDAGVRDASSDGMSIAIATGDYDGTTEITSRSVDVSESIDVGASAGIILLVNAPQDGSGTAALLSVTPTEFVPAASAGATGTNTLLTATNTFNTTSGSGDTPTVWTTTTKS